MHSRVRWFACAAALAAVTTVYSTASSGDEANAPAFCAPVKEAFQGLFGLNSSSYQAYAGAAEEAVEALDEAASSAPAELGEVIEEVAEYYEEVAEFGEPLGIDDLWEIQSEVGELSEAVVDQCGFTLEGTPI